jgi:hypothetical protein
MPQSSKAFAPNFLIQTSFAPSEYSHLLSTSNKPSLNHIKPQEHEIQELGRYMYMITFPNTKKFNVIMN